jgi:hypothetical protein
MRGSPSPAPRPNSLYIDLIQSEATFPLIRELYDKEAPGIYFSSIVELLTGARS